jgi:hypothetical protein
MNDELFAELVASVKEGGSILRDETPASRSFQLDGTIETTLLERAPAFHPILAKSKRRRYRVTRKPFTPS